jgi:hypothetical protein
MIKLRAIKKHGLYYVVSGSPCPIKEAVCYSAGGFDTPLRSSSKSVSALTMAASAAEAGYNNKPTQLSTD